ncbi:esterase [Planctomyces sp. SH-PL14]|uniref:esterase n=1 Tax=Planctomyces sp. SH-PL14 TaxID=1632864 RepID=UPI00078E3AA2|nr:esterase [Planctomyces sp. SH-PL14]AMV22655.1 Carbohydrate acetyl esterase/feruloyl esterase precursor [Planctomyces sp. SH-PL14]
MRVRLLIPLVAVVLVTNAAHGQNGFGPRPPAFESVEVSSERALTFRLFAPKAEEVRLVSADLPGSDFAGRPMKKRDDGVWEATTAAVPAGAYRYHFHVDGLAVMDPRNPATSESNMNASSLVLVPGSASFDTRDVPHGAISQVTYHSQVLSRQRRLHVYTPPGYERGTETYPVLYLLHGAFDCDASWSSIGRAGAILDNLIADGGAKPMVVVMPMGHTGPFQFGPGGNFEKQMKEFVEEFQRDIRPLAETRYRLRDGREHRAIAGLSMGGAQTLEIALANLADYGDVGVFSSGVFGIDRGDGAEKWIQKHSRVLEDAEVKKDVRVWFATGREDFLIGTSRKTVEVFKEKGFAVTYVETAGGHTWLNWRDYLHQFAPRLFQREGTAPAEGSASKPAAP